VLWASIASQAFHPGHENPKSRARKGLKWTRGFDSPAWFLCHLPWCFSLSRYTFSQSHRPQLLSWLLVSWDPAGGSESCSISIIFPRKSMYHELICLINNAVLFWWWVNYSSWTTSWLSHRSLRTTPPPPFLPLIAAREGRRQAVHPPDNMHWWAPPCSSFDWDSDVRAVALDGEPNSYMPAPPLLVGRLCGGSVGGVPWSYGRRGMQRKNVLAWGLSSTLLAHI
jgi:hypothetical protein